MSWPSDDLTNTHLDAGTDDPSQARGELNSLLLKVQAIIAGAVSAATVSCVVLRDASGDFAANIITAAKFIGNIAAADGTVVMNSGTDGSDATFAGAVNGAITGDVHAGNAEKVVENGATADAADFLDSSGNSRLFPAGGIIMWSGTVAAIPNGWKICDGTNSTPDLTDRFVIHADADSGGTNDVGDSGDATGLTAGHALSIAEMPSHDHDFEMFGFQTEGGGTRLNTVSDSDSTLGTVSFADTVNTGGGGSHSHDIASVKPKYYALAYIMKA